MTLDREHLTPADVIMDVAVMVACAFFLLYFRIGIISGNSMAPTLHDGDNVVFSSTTFNSRLRRGDIIIFDSDCGTLVKRVIAVPGDVISISGGVVYLDGERVDEDYTAPGFFASGDMDYPVTIPFGYYFVLGDNRPESRDSRMRCVGLISEEDIIGKVLLM